MWAIATVIFLVDAAHLTVLESLVQLIEPSDPDDTPDEVILESLQQALNGQTIPLSQMWDSIDAE